MSEHLQHYDIVIVGAGLVGTSLVVALAAQGFKIAILEKNIPQLNNIRQDDRPLALNYGSQKILNTLGVWNLLASQAAPIHKVHVTEQNQFGQLRITADECGVPALGYVVSFGQLQMHLYQRAIEYAEIIQSESILNIHIDDQVHLHYRDSQCERTLTADLLVAADGSQSACRELLGIKVKTIDPEETAWVAEIKLQGEHKHCAYQRFCKDGILALLPLADKNTMRLVWTLAKNSAEKITLKDIQAHWQGYVPGIIDYHLLAQYPLKTLIAQQQIKPHAVILGNAAHTLYPLAAQGFNLGLRDVAMLSECLAEALKNQLGDVTVLQKYLQQRQQDQKKLNYFTTGLHDLFSLQLPLLGKFRGIGLLGLDLIPSLKQRLAKRAMGLAPPFTKLQRGIPL